MTDVTRLLEAANPGGLSVAADLLPLVDDESLALHEALDRLAAAHPEKAAVKLRYFAGLTANQAAEALSISSSTVDRHWTFARAWLRRAMSSPPGA